jgi:hypothetical protein
MARKPREALIDSLALAVAGGLSIAAAARSLEIPERTARGWAAAPEFKASVTRLRQEVMSQSVGILGRLAVKASATLGKLLDSQDEDIRLKASKQVLDAALAVREAAEFSERLAAVEDRLGANNAKRIP